MEKQDLGPEQQKSELVEDLLKEIENQDEKEYLEDVTLKQQLLVDGEIFDGASLKLTDEMIAQIKTAVGSRMKATAPYTRERIDQINENYQLHQDNIARASDGTAQSKTYFGEIYNSDEDWVDNLYVVFNELPDKFEVDDIEDKLDTFMAKKMEVSERDESKQPFKMLRSLLNIVTKGQAKESDMFYFQKKEAIKTITRDALHKSGFSKKLEDFMRKGIIQGEFCCKDKYGPSSAYDVVCDDETGTYKVKRDSTYLFTPIDTRLLIYPKTNRRWCIEKIPTTFSEVLGLCLDENNKPKENAPYDIDMLKKVADYIKNKGVKGIKKQEPDSSDNKDDYSSDVLTSDIDKLWDIDGDITVYEAHYIPLLLDIKGQGKMPYKTLIHFFNMADDDAIDETEPEIIPIGCRLTPYTAGLPYHFAPMIEKDGEMAGMGLPEKLKPLQTLLNDMLNHSIDLANLALWGIMIIDPDAFKETLSMRNLAPRQILKLKDMKGRSVEQVVQWLHPATGSLQMMETLMPKVDDMITRTARKGPGAKSIYPKVSATEAQSIIGEQQKNVNKVALRINELLLDVMYRMYIYTVTNRLEPFRVKVSGYRIQAADDYQMIEKLLDVDPKEIMISGLNFRLVGIDATDKKAVANQQKMQAFQLITTSGAMKNPDGSPHMMTDDSGAKVQISEYKVMKEILNDMNFDDVIERVKPEQAAQQTVMPPAGPTGAPPLAAGTNTADVVKQAALSKGVNV